MRLPPSATAPHLSDDAPVCERDAARGSLTFQERHDVSRAALDGEERASI
jgi:hypothetical protein